MLDEPIQGECGVCRQPRELRWVVLWEADELAICRECYEAPAGIGRLSGVAPGQVELELP